jgi:hypothetical protein
VRLPACASPVGFCFAATARLSYACVTNHGSDAIPGGRNRTGAPGASRRAMGMECCRTSVL